MKLWTLVFRGILRVYPQEFRSRFGAEMLLDFQDGLRAAQADGRRTSLAFLVRNLTDTLLSVPREHAAGFRFRRAWPTFLAVSLAIPVGYLDSVSRPVQPVVLAILVLAGSFGLAQPKRAVTWALLFGGSVPVWHFVGTLLGYKPDYPVEPGTYASLIALIPGFVGAGIGAGIRSAASIAVQFPSN